MFVDLACADAVDFAKDIPDNTVDLYICDPPFGIGEEKFNAVQSVEGWIEGYVPAEDDYYTWSKEWLTEMYRTLKPEGTAYVILGSSYKLADAMIAARDVGFYLLNHIIWHYNTYIVPTKKKFSSSHYHILRLGKRKSGQTFNVPTDQEIEATYKKQGMNAVPEGRNGGPKFYDMMDVWRIKKVAVKKGEKKNLNTLPHELVRKMIIYSSNPGDIVCDLFMGNFTTAKVAIEEGRSVMGCEKNPNACDHWIDRIMDDFESKQ